MVPVRSASDQHPVVPTPDGTKAATDEADRGPSAPTRRLPEVPWDRCFLVVGILFGVFLAVATPPLQEHDAVGHLVRVDRMSRGTLVEPLDDRGQASASVDACLHGFVEHHVQRSAGDTQLDLRGNWGRVGCTTPSEMTISGSALTSPLPYVPNAAGYTVARLLGGGVGVRLLAARLTSLAAFVLVVWAALRLAPKGRAVLFAVAVLPSTLALAAGLHADSTGIAAAILSVALTLRARELPDRRILLGLTASLVVLALAKNLYSPFVLLVLLVPATAFADRWARRRFVAVTAVVAGVSLAAWSSYAARIHYVTPALGIDSEEAQSHVLHHPVAFLHSAWNGLWDPFFRDVTLPGFVEVLGGMRTDLTHHVYGDLPPPAIVGVAVVVLGLAVFADPGPTPRGDTLARRQVALATGTIAVAGVLLVYLGMALTANPPGARSLVWAQGRYFIPLVPLLAFAAGRRVRHQHALALSVPVGSLLLLAWVGWRVSVVFY